MDKNKKKKSNSFMKVYAITCVISLSIGVLSFAATKKMSQSVFEINKNAVKVPILEDINITETENRESELEMVEKREEKKESTENINTEDSVKVFNSTDIKDVKGITLTEPCKGTLLKRFSKDKPIKSITMGDFRIHNGIDIRCTLGDSVLASADGVVEKIYEDNLLGTIIMIKHSDDLATEYANMACGDMVYEGKEVKSGESIGCVGNTAKGELLEEAHLHFSVLKNEEYQNPLDFVNYEELN